ncbi:MAG: Metal-dependent hydrolase YbeY, involved in rRNA and/or ribosome maturation and assembly, partial [uncultured Nocardioides sp.]
TSCVPERSTRSPRRASWATWSWRRPSPSGRARRRATGGRPRSTSSRCTASSTCSATTTPSPRSTPRCSASRASCSRAGDRWSTPTH